MYERTACQGDLAVARSIALEVAKTAGPTWLRASAGERSNGMVITLEFAKHNCQAIELLPSHLRNPKRAVIQVLAKALGGLHVRPALINHRLPASRP